MCGFAPAAPYLIKAINPEGSQVFSWPLPAIGNAAAMAKIQLGIIPFDSALDSAQFGYYVKIIELMASMRYYIILLNHDQRTFFCLASRCLIPPVRQASRYAQLNQIAH